MKFHDFLVDPMLGNLGAETFRVWHVAARLIDGDAAVLTAEDRAIATAITGRTAFPSQPAREFYAAPGRRSGKTLFCSRLAVWKLAFDYTDRLQRGETAAIACIATDRRQAGLLFGYARACVVDSPLLSQQLTRETADTLEFAHGTSLEVHTASFRATRGRTFAAVLLDEAAFLRSDDSATPDIEIVRAVRPGLATLGGMLVVLSSPYMRRGVLFDAYRKHHANDASAAIYVTGPTRTFNPTLDGAVIDEAMADDPESARSEWGGEFRNDLSAAFDPAWIDRATDAGIAERPRIAMLPMGRAPAYVAFTDPAGGAGKDSWCTAVAHAERDALVLDALLEIAPPFSTAEAAARVAEFLRGYGTSFVHGDRYAGRWPADALAAHGIGYLESERDKSTIYLETIPLFSAGRVRLLDQPKLLSQLRLLERRTRAGGRDSIDHPGGRHDDAANAAAGALLLASRGNAGSELAGALRAGATLGVGSEIFRDHAFDEHFSSAGGPCPPRANRW